MEVNVKKFSDLLVDYLEPESKIINTNIDKLPLGGAGSIMVRAEVTVKTKSGTEDTLFLVVKLIPPTKEFKELFQIEHTFKNEVSFYKTIVPTLQNFQKHQGVSEILNNFAKFYGARLSLDGVEVDDDAALVLENLVEAGFKHITPIDGFDLDGAKVVLKDLARFQGTAIALKLKQPEVFNKNIKVTCRDFHFPTMIAGVTETLRTILKQNSNCAHLGAKITEWPSKIPEAREPYASIAHGDLWVNNTMQKFENDKIVANKFVDFQLYSYRSCASDVFFFLWTSCSLTVLQNELDYLLEYYHDNLIDTLKELHCDFSGFSLDKFLEEMRLESEYEFGHTVVFILLTKCKKPGSISSKDRSSTDGPKIGGPPRDGPPIGEPPKGTFPSADKFLSIMPAEMKEYYCFMVQECDKRGWLH